MEAGGITISNKSRTKPANLPSSARTRNFPKSKQDRNQEGCSSSDPKVQRRKCMFRLKIQSMGPVCKTRKKTNCSSQICDQAYEEGNEGWLNHDEESSMWLFSGSSSPSCCFDDKIFKNFLDFSLDDWLVSALVLRDSSSPILDLSKATSLFDEMLKEDDFLEQETTSWLMESFGLNDEFSQYGEDCKYVEHSLYPSKKSFGLLENTNIQEVVFDSLIDLEVSSEWISDSEINFLQIDFPSPSYKNIWGYSVCQLSDLVPAVGYPAGAEFTEAENIVSDEPIFWPLVQKFDWSSEFFRDFLVMSPRENKFEDEKLIGNLSEQLEISRQNNGISFKAKHKSCFYSRMAPPKMLEPQGQDKIKTDEKMIFIEDVEEVLDEHKLMLLEEDFLGVEELPIEQVIGLNEFDGLEGINLECEKDCFFVYECF